MISKMDKGKKWKTVRNEEGKKKYNRLRNKLKRSTEKDKKEYLERKLDAIIEFQRTGRYFLI
jgi:hypothetical protein